MRGDDAVFRRQQRIVGPDGLRGDHVQPGVGHLAAVQSVRQILLYHHLSTAVVDDDDAVLHLGDVFLVDDAGVEVHQGHLKAQHVRPGEQVVQLHELHAQILGSLRGELVIGDDVHPQSLGGLGGVDADAAAAQQTEGLAGQLNEGIVPVTPFVTVLPLAVMDGLVMMADVEAGFQHQSNSELADGIAAVVRHVAHGDAPLSGGSQIHHVETSGQYGDHFHIGTFFQGGLGNGGFVHHHDLRVTNALSNEGRFLIGGAVINRYLA